MPNRMFEDLDAEILLDNLLMELPDIGLITWNGEGRITSLSETCRRLMQLPRSAKVGGPVSILWQSPCKPFMQALEGFVAQPNQGSLERELQLMRDGERYWLHLKVRPCPKSCGTQSAYLLLARDITHKHLLMQAAEQSHDLFDAAFRCMPDAAILVDQTRCVLKASQGVERLLGYREEELIGESSHIFYADDEGFHQQMEIADTAGPAQVPAPQIVTYRRKSGELFQAESLQGPLYDRSGELLGHICILRDITDRLSLESELLEQSEMLDSIFRQLPFALGVIDTTRHFVQMSDAALALFGHPQEAMVGQSTRMIYASDEAYEQAGRQLHAENPFASVITEMRTRSGREFRGRIQFSPLYDAAHRLKGYLAGFEDVTEQLGQLEVLHRYERMVSASSDALVFLDRQHVYQAVNEAYLKLWRKQRQEVIGHHILEVVGEVFYEQVTAPALEQCFRGEPVDIPVTFVTYPSGSWYMEATHDPYRDEQGAISGVLITLRNVSQRHLAEQAVLESEEKFRAIFEHAPVGVGILDETDGSVLDINTDGAQMLGYSRDEIMQLRPWDVTEGLTPEEFLSSWQQMRQKGRVRFESTHIKKDGARIQVLIHANSLTLQGRPVQLMTVVDITRQKQLESRLREQEEQYRSLVESTGAILFSADPETFRFTFVSQEAESLLGYPLRLWTEDADFWVSHIHPDDRSWAPGFCMESTRKRQDHSFDYRMIAADGRIVWLHDVTSVVTDGERVTSLVGVMVDISEHRRAEEDRLRLSEIVEQSVDAILLTDTEFRITYINKAFHRLYGYTLEELRGRKPEILIAEENVEEIHPLIYDALRAGWRVHRELLDRRKDGSLFTCQHNFSPLCNEAGETIAYMSSQRDISKRVAAERALRLSEERWQYALEGAGEGVWDWNLETNQVFYSRRWKAMLGYGEDELGDSFEVWENLMHPHDLPECIGRIDRYLRGESPVYRSEHRLRCKDGGYKWILARGELREWTAAGKPLRMIGTHQDITQRRDAEEALRKSEERYRQIVETAQEGIWVIDKQARTTFVNPSMARILGYAEAEMLGRRLYDFMDETARKQAEVRLEERRQGLSSVHDFRFRHKTGRDVWTSVSANPLFDEKGDFIGAMAMIDDISETRKLQDALISSQKMEAVGQLTGGIAHDFNNILGSILGFTELAQERFGAQHDKLREYLQQIETAGGRARDLIRQLMIFSRGESTQAAASIPLAPLVQEVVRMLGPMLPAMVEIRTELPPVSPHVIIDPLHVQQLLMNLCINARDAIDGAGVITITLAARRIDHEHCSICSQMLRGEWVSLRVSDTGRGIPAELQGEIFQPFVTSKGVGEGSGMGLAVVRGILRSYEAHLIVTSVQGQGASFEILLPPSQSEQQGTGAAYGEMAAPLNLQGRSILVVDDELQILAYFKALFSELGAEVVCCSNGAQALGRFVRAAGRFDLVISDEIMPGMNGSELVRQLRALGSEVPVILCSGYSERLAEAQAEAEMIIAQLQKPVSKARLLAVMGTIFAARLPSAEAPDG